MRYALLNLRASWDDIRGTGLGAALFMNNVTDKYYRNLPCIKLVQKSGLNSKVP